MSPDKFVRRALQTSVPFNLGAAVLFAFPGSALGRIAGLPASVPGLYCAMLAFFVALFGCTYAWLAIQRDIDRPLVAFSTIGKTGAFLTILGFWIAGEVPVRGVVLATGDLVLAAVFAWWLMVTSDSAAAHDAIAEVPSR